MFGMHKKSVIQIFTAINVLVAIMYI